MKQAQEKIRINMLSQAHRVKGQGVLSAYEEQVGLVKNGLSDRFEVTENRVSLPDITHIHTVNPSYFLSIPFLELRGTTVGYVHFLPETLENSLNLPKLFRQVFYKYLIGFYKSLDHLVVVNPYFIDRLEEYGVPREKITYIPNFVSDEEFYPYTPEQKRQARQRWGLDPDRFTVMCAGQLQTRKGVMDFAEIARRMPQVQFIWAGGFSFGQMTDGYRQIKELLDNPPKNLVFPGMIEREQMNEIYNLGDVMFLPSYEELFPMTVLEAMSANIPILLRDIPIYEKILMDFYLKGKDQEEFIAILQRLESDPSYRQQACDASRRGHAFYSRGHVLELWKEFYTSILQEKPSFRARINRKLPFGKEF